MVSLMQSAPEGVSRALAATAATGTAVSLSGAGASKGEQPSAEPMPMPGASAGEGQEPLAPQATPAPGDSAQAQVVPSPQPPSLQQPPQPVDGEALDGPVVPPPQPEAEEAEEEEDASSEGSDDSEFEPPTPRAAPQGLAGLLRIKRGRAGADTPSHAYEVLDLTNLPPSTVLVHVYDVGDEEIIKKVNRISTMSDQVLIGGVFHAGVEVFGREWGFGFTEDGGSGVCYVTPRCNRQHTYRATVVMSPTKLTETEVNQLLQRLANEWPGAAYDLIHRNCCDFASVTCEELGVGRIPGWINRLGRTASKLDKFGQSAKAQVEKTRTMARAVSTDVGQAFAATDIALAFREIGKEVEETWGPARQVIGTSLWSWGSGLLVAGKRALAEGSERPKHKTCAGSQPSNGDLRAALRNRGGAAVRNCGGG